MFDSETSSNSTRGVPESMDLKRFQRYTAQAPDLLRQIAYLLQECEEKDILLPEGIRNLCDLSWEELSDIPAYAKTFHQPKSSNLFQGPETYYRMPTVTSHGVLPASPKMHALQKVAGRSNLKLNKTLANYSAAFIPVTSAVRLYLEEDSPYLSFNLTYKEVSSDSTCHRYSYETLRVCWWAVDKMLGPTLDQIKDEEARLKERGHIHALMTQHYKDSKVHQVQPLLKPSAGGSLLPVVPNTRSLSFPVSSKLHYRLPDGTNFLYYPSGSVAVCQIPNQKPGGGLYTNVFTEDTSDILATFRPNGHGFVYHLGGSRSSCFALLVESSGCQLYNEEGCLTKEWAFRPKAPHDIERTFKVNECLTLTVSNRMSMRLNFHVQTDRVTLCLREAHMELGGGGVDDGGFAAEQSARAGLEACRKELQEIRKRARDTSLRWLQHYVVATGLSDEPLLPITKHKPLKPKEAWGANPRVVTPTVESPPVQVPPPSLKTMIAPPATCSLHISRPRTADKRRVKSACLPSVPYSSALLRSETPPCPVVLRLALQNYKDQPCRCSTRLPVLSDLELDLFLSAPGAPRGHVLVVYITSSSSPPPQPYVENVLRRMYQKQVHASSSPCTKCSRDLFRLVKYDIDRATGLTHWSVPLLVQRHHVGPGTFLMYAGGKLVFGGRVLNGYGFSRANLLKQIAKTRSDYTRGFFLPQDYKLESLRGTALDFVPSKMSGLVSIPAMKSKRQQSRARRLSRLDSPPVLGRMTQTQRQNVLHLSLI